jgi:hypothetical protein
MTLPTVSNQGFTVHNHVCGINFLSHFRGAPQNSRQTGMVWDEVGYPGRGTDRLIGTSGDLVIGRAKIYHESTETPRTAKIVRQNLTADQR